MVPYSKRLKFEPTQVVQYLDGNALSGGASLHPDPAMVIVPSLQRYTKDITFSTSRISNGTNPIEANNYITIVANSASYQSLQLDGSLVGECYVTCRMQNKG